MSTVHFANHHCDLAFGSYEKGGLAVMLKDHETNKLVATASIYAPTISPTLPPAQFLLNTSQAGIREALGRYITIERHVMDGNMPYLVTTLRPQACTCMSDNTVKSLIRYLRAALKELKTSSEFHSPAVRL